MLDYEFIIFQWDSNKNESNIQKHGISFELAHYAFFDPHVQTNLHQVVDGEERWKTLGKIEGEIVVFIGHLLYDNEDEKEVIRMITARKATKQEVREYYANYPR